MCQMRSLSSQLKEMEEDRNRTEGRLHQLQRSLVEAEEGKLSLHDMIFEINFTILCQHLQYFGKILCLQFMT